MSSPILKALSDASACTVPAVRLTRAPRASSFQEDLGEPEDEPCKPCSQAPRALSAEGPSHLHSDQTDPIPEYVAKIREGIKQQAERLQKEEAGKDDEQNSAQQLDFHIKVVRKKRPAPLLLNVKATGNHLFSTIKSRAQRARFEFPRKTKPDERHTRVVSPPPGRISLSSLANKVKKELSAIRSRRARRSVSFPPLQSKLQRPSQERPKIKSRGSAPATPLLAKSTREKKRNTLPMVAAAVEEGMHEGEEVALLSIRSSIASPTESYNATHFYTPMVPSRWRGEHGYRHEKSRFRKSVDVSRKAVTRGTRSVRLHARNVLSERHKGRGWSRIH